MPDFKSLAEGIPTSISKIGSVAGIKGAPINFESKFKITLKGNESFPSLCFNFTLPVYDVFTGVSFLKERYLRFVKQTIV